jgi:hypothetical protein
MAWVRQREMTLVGTNVASTPATMSWFNVGQWQQDLGLMVEHPLATAEGFADGYHDGEMIVANAFTLGLVPGLNDHVQEMIAKHGSGYVVAGVAADISASATSAIIPCGPLANAVKVMEFAASVRDVYEGYQNGNVLQMAGGLFGVGSGSVGKWCFVAGTQVVVGELPVAEPVIVAPDGDTSQRLGLGWTAVFVGLGLVAAEVVRAEMPRKRTQQRRAENPERDTRDPRADNVDRVFTDGLWSDDAKSDANSTANEPATSSTNLVDLPPRQTTSDQPPSRRSPLLWLAASLLLAGFLTLGGLFSAGETESRPVAQTVAESSAPRWQTKNIEDLQVGDRVLAWDEQTGRQELKPIDRTYVRTADHLRHVTLRNSDGSEQTLHTTDEHPFYVVGRGWINAGELEPGDQLRQADQLIAAIVATSREDKPDGHTVYNLRVVDSHTYFAAADVTAEPVLVHNANYDFGNFMHQAALDEYLKTILKIDPAKYKLSVMPGELGPDITLLTKAEQKYFGFKYGDLKPDTPYGYESLFEQMGSWKKSAIGLFLYDPSDVATKENIWFSGIYKYNNNTIYGP